MLPGAITGQRFAESLIRRTDHFDVDITRDITPTEGWIGHVSTGVWPAFAGNTAQFDRIHRVYPDLSGAWNTITHGSCLNDACDPTEQKIGMGYTQEEYSIQTKSYGTDLFCFDQSVTADRAKEQYDGLVKTLRDATNIILSDRYRREALRIASNKVCLRSGLPAFAYTLSADEMTLTPNYMPTSLQTIKAMMRQVQPLLMAGALNADPAMPPMFEYVTDIETGQRLREGNEELQDKWRFTDFVRGGNLYKYGITDSIGNFGFRYDPFPMRFLINGSTLVRVMPYTNVASSTSSGIIGSGGIRGNVNQKYIDAPVQLDFIWNRYAMKTLTREMRPINSQMPFLTRDMAGKWQFGMDNLGADSRGHPIENVRRNKGKFFADFANGTKPVRPEWVVAFLVQRQRAVFEVEEPTDTDRATYAAQDYTSDNEACSYEVTLEHGSISDITIGASTILCNGVNISHPASGTLADQAAVVAWLTANLSELGTWEATDTDEITLTGALCSTVSIPALPAAS